MSAPAPLRDPLVLSPFRERRHCSGPVSPALPYPKGAAILTVQPTYETLSILRDLLACSRVLQALAQDLCRQSDETRATAAALRRQSRAVSTVQVRNAPTS